MPWLSDSTQRSMVACTSFGSLMSMGICPEKPMYQPMIGARIRDLLASTRMGVGRRIRVGTSSTELWLATMT